MHIGASPSQRTARPSCSIPGLELHGGPRTRDGRGRTPIARRAGRPPPHANHPTRPRFGRLLPEPRRKPSPPRSRTSRKISQCRLALNLPDIHGRADLFLDLYRKGRPDRRDAREVTGVRFLQVLERLVAPLEQRPSADPPDATEGDQLEELLFDAVLHLDGEPRERSDFLLVEDATEFAHRVEEPLRLVRHAADVSGANAEYLRYFLLGSLRDPVIEEGGCLDLREEEIVVLNRECQIRLLDLLLDPGVVAAAEIELRHVRGRADGPQVEETVVAGLVESVAHLNRAERIDVQIARTLPEEGGS